MLSTALYWNTDKAGIADPNKKTLCVIASPALVLWKKMPTPDNLDGGQNFQRQSSSTRALSKDGWIAPPRGFLRLTPKLARR
jgi:hypothetical protein